MRFAMRSGLLAASLLALLCSRPAGSADIPIPAKIGLIKDTKLFKIVSKPVGSFTIPTPGGAGDPRFNTNSLEVSDTDATGSLSDFLFASAWQGLGNPAGSKGYKYKNPLAPSGGAVKLVILKPNVIKILAKDDGSLDGPIGGNLSVVLSTGSDRYCADFGGVEVKNDPGLWKYKDAGAPASCPGTTCCDDNGFLNFTTVNAPGDCGDVIDSSGVLVRNINCGSHYAGGGGNTVPLPTAAPDLASMTTTIASCASDVATVGAATSAQTGSLKNCTAAGCSYGPPRPVPHVISTPSSTCVVPKFTAAPTGTVNCGTGQTNLNLTLSWDIYASGDTSGAAGLQPCPRCIAGICEAGANAGGGCVPGTTAVNPGYPTSTDCPPTAAHLIGTLPVQFTLSSGVVTWTGTTATNDTPGTAVNQLRVFSGYCRDRELPGGTNGWETPTQKCWENGMAVGPPCGGDTFETCEQRTGGAFGPNGGTNMTIRAIGNAMSILGGPAPATLVSIFSLPPSFDSLYDSTYDLPGPAAVALPGTARTCADAMACP